MEPIKFLKIGGDLVARGTEADLVNMAASFDSDYEIVEEEDLNEEEKKQVTELIKAIEEAQNDKL